MSVFGSVGFSGFSVVLYRGFQDLLQDPLGRYVGLRLQGLRLQFYPP